MRTTNRSGRPYHRLAVFWRNLAFRIPTLFEREFQEQLAVLFRTLKSIRENYCRPGRHPLRSTPLVEVSSRFTILPHFKAACFAEPAQGRVPRGVRGLRVHI